MLLAALRRFALLVLFSVSVTVVGSLLFGLLIGASVERSLALGFYLVGCFLLISGFFVGNRGPTRVDSESPAPMVLPMLSLAGRRLRWASLREQNETIASSAVFICLGLILVAVGILVDSRRSLF
jgi:hypothetical protein